MAVSIAVPACLRPRWPAPANVHALTTLRKGGNSSGAYSSFNLALHSGDDASAVNRNRALLREHFALPAEPVWLQQVHGKGVVDANTVEADSKADGSWSDTAGRVCAVMTADCLPVLICNREGSKVAAAHAGWRGLHAGVISSAVSRLNIAADQLLVWLGPAIGPQAFEVGAEVMHAFVEKDRRNAVAFRQTDAQHWLCDIYKLARNELDGLGIGAVYGGDECTYTDAARFYSYRRDGDTGRMASLIWLQN